jgi:hypothetical protein
VTLDCATPARSTVPPPRERQQRTALAIFTHRVGLAGEPRLAALNPAEAEDQVTA